MPEQEEKRQEEVSAPKKKGVFGCSFPLFIGLLVIVLVLLVVGLLSGPIGKSIFSSVQLPPWLGVSQPEPELPAEVVFHIFGFPITNSIVATWLTMIVLVGFCFAATRQMKLNPGRLQTLLEFVLGTFLLGFCQTVAGKKNGRRFFPIVATIFLFVLFNGWLSLLPGFGSVGVINVTREGLDGLVENVKSLNLSNEAEDSLVSTLDKALASLYDGEKEEAIHYWEVFIEIVNEQRGHELTSEQTDELISEAKKMEPHLLRGANTDINTPLAIAFMSFIFVEFFGLRILGLGYLKKFINVGQFFSGLGQLVKGKIGAGLSGMLMGVINIFIGLIELLSEFVRIVSFTLRLFGNMTAGEILLLMATFLVPFVFADIFYGFELLFGFIQALIFASLTLIFLTVAVTSHEHSEHGEEAHK